MRPHQLDQNLFDRLSRSDGTDLVSLFMSSHPKGREVSQDAIRLKNLLAEADLELENLGFKPRERRARLRTARDLLDDREFWEHQGQGLAVYIDGDGSVAPVALGYPVEECALVMPVFLMRPLLAELMSPALPVLALSRGEVGLFVASKTDARRADADLPESLDDVNWFVDRERQRQQHPDRTGTGRARHGHDPSVREDEDLSRFLRQVEDAVPGDGVLIVLGDDDLVARFEALADRPVKSPPNSGLRSPFTESEIREAAVPVMTEIAAAKEMEALADAAEELATGNATPDISAAMEGALTGRVGQLVLDPTIEPVWGRIEESTLEVTIHDERKHADVDLVDRVVVLSMRNGADVTPVGDGSNQHSLIAVMRF